MDGELLVHATCLETLLRSRIAIDPSRRSGFAIGRSPFASASLQDANQYGCSSIVSGLAGHEPSMQMLCQETPQDTG